MAEVSVTIGNFSYQVACRDGEEAHLERLGARVDAKAQEARGAVGNVSEVRQLLLAALLLADECETPVSASPAPSPDRSEALEAIAARAEAIADRLENGVARA